jgi:ABC-2 type transport system ATP-binding protein
VVKDGRIVAEGTPAELKARTGSDVVELRDHDDALVTEIPTDGTIQGLRAAIAELELQLPTGSVALRRPSLDDVFLALTEPGTPPLPIVELVAQKGTAS